MQTIDIQEMITLAQLTESTWAKENAENKDVELDSVLEALVACKLPSAQTMGYLIDREVFTSKQYMLLVSLLDEMSPPSTGRQLCKTADLHKLSEPGVHAWLEMIDEERKELRDSRPREANNTIQMFLRSFVVCRVYAESLDKIAPSLLSRNLFEVSTTQLKTAFFHFLRGAEATEELTSFYLKLQAVINANPPIDNDDYEA